MSEITLVRSIGLSEAEAALLIASAVSVMPQVREHLSAHQLREPEYAEKALREKASKGEISEQQQAEYYAALTLCQYQPESFVPLVLGEVAYGDSYTEHPSFGSVDRNLFTSTNPRVFGSPYTGHNLTGLRFLRGIVSIGNKESKSAPFLREGMTLCEVHMSIDQFAGLLRDRRSHSPCALEFLNFSTLDVPPRMLSSFDTVDTVAERMRQICQPVYVALDAMRNYLMSGERISSKADYAELVSRAELIGQALRDAKAPIQALMQEAAGTSAEAATRQMIAEITEPVKALGMDADSLFVRLT
ncbi:MAG: hypothetical protein RSD49_06760 [Hafnia sp.]